MIFPEAWLRSQLNRLVRTTQGHIKNAELPVYSVAPLLADWPSKPNISLY